MKSIDAWLTYPWMRTLLGCVLLLLPGVPERIEQALARILTALGVVFVVLAASAALSALDDLYQVTPRGRERSIKGCIQLVKIALFLIAVILVIAPCWRAARRGPCWPVWVPSRRCCR